MDRWLPGCLDSGWTDSRSRTCADTAKSWHQSEYRDISDTRSSHAANSWSCHRRLQTSFNVSSGLQSYMLHVYADCNSF